MSAFKTIFIDGQLLGVLIGSGISYLIYRASQESSREFQKNIWKKEFDKYQTEPLLEIFRNILVVINNNAVRPINSAIPDEHLNELKIRTHLIRYFTESLKQTIIQDIYNLCLEYNQLDIVNNSIAQSSTENEGRIEKEKREAIEKNILKIVDEIKKNYSEF